MKWEDEMPLAEKGEDLFTNVRPGWSMPGRRGVAGCVLTSHSVLAAHRTLPEGFVLHNLFCNFYATTKSDVDVMYQVERSRDGKSFSLRTVKVIHSGTVCAVVSMSFTRASEAAGPTLNYSISMPENVKHPVADDADDNQLRTKTGGYIECRRGPIVIENGERPETYKSREWIRAIGPISSPAGDKLHQAALVYISDLCILDAPPRLFGLNLGYPSPPVFPDTVVGQAKPPIKPGVKAGDKPSDNDVLNLATLNHTINIHAPLGFCGDQWMLLDANTEWARDGRMLIRSRLFTKDGLLVATCNQEGLLLLKDRPYDNPFVSQGVRAKI